MSGAFGNLVTTTATPKLGVGGTAVISYPASRLTAAQSHALKGPITSALLHLVIAGSPFVDTTYALEGARETSARTAGAGTVRITLTYTNVKKAR